MFFQQELTKVSSYKISKIMFCVTINNQTGKTVQMSSAVNLHCMFVAFEEFTILRELSSSM